MFTNFDLLGGSVEAILFGLYGRKNKHTKRNNKHANTFGCETKVSGVTKPKKGSAVYVGLAPLVFGLIPLCFLGQLLRVFETLEKASADSKISFFNRPFLY